MKTLLTTAALGLLALGATLTALTTPAQAQAPTDWPTRPVRILVGSAPGGGTDAMARAVADRLGPLLKQPVVVDNRPGVSNTLAADATAKATDGHTLVMGVSTAHAIAPHLLKLGYDSNKDLVPVAFVGAVPNVLVVTNSLPVDSVQSLVKLAKSKPGQLNYATSGAGSTQHIAAELFKDATGVFITHIPYRGSGPAMVDLIGGQVQISFETLPSVISHVKSGKIKALAVASARRNPESGAGAGAAGSQQGAGHARNPGPTGRHRRRNHADDAGQVPGIPQRRVPALWRADPQKEHQARLSG